MFRVALISIEAVQNGFLINVQKDGDMSRVPFPQFVARNGDELISIVSRLFDEERMRCAEWMKENTFGDGSR